MDIRALGQVVAPLSEGLAELVDVVGGDGAIAQGELPGGAVGHDLDRIDFARLRQRRGDRREAILTGVDHYGGDVARQLGQQLIAVFDTAVEHQQAARCRWRLLGGGRAFGRGRMRDGGVTRRRRGGRVRMLLIGCRRSGRTVEKNPWFQRKRLALRTQMGAETWMP
ncbi:hypothetical protein D3C76_642580 [compost metagenome]